MSSLPESGERPAAAQLPIPPAAQASPAPEALTVDATTADTTILTTPPAKPNRRKLLPWLVLLALLGAGIYFGLHYWTVGRYQENTNNAYIKTDVVWVTPRIGGEVTRLFVKANQPVRAGEPLLQLDDRDAQARLAQAQAGVSAREAALGVQQANRQAQQAQVEQARSRISAVKADIRQAESRVRAAQAEVTRTSQEQARYQRLLAEGVTTRQRAEAVQAQATAAQANLDQARAAVLTAQAGYDQALAGISAAQAQVGAVDASREQMLADIEAARSQVTALSVDTESSQVVAPTSGIIGSMAVRLGARVGPQTRLMAIVPEKQAYIEANFKETQIGRMTVGQPVTIKLDAFPDRTFNGRITSFAPASGAEFSLMPPDNATGNFNKVVQRVPVRISLDNVDDATYQRLRPGLSAEVTVNVRGQ